MANFKDRLVVISSGTAGKKYVSGAWGTPVLDFLCVLHTFLASRDAESVSSENPGFLVNTRTNAGPSVRID